MSVIEEAVKKMQKEWIPLERWLWNLERAYWNCRLEWQEVEYIWREEEFIKSYEERFWVKIHLPTDKTLREFCDEFYKKWWIRWMK